MRVSGAKSPSASAVRGHPYKKVDRFQAPQSRFRNAKRMILGHRSMIPALRKWDAKQLLAGCDDAHRFLSKAADSVDDSVLI